MEIYYHRKFKKSFTKLPSSTQNRFFTALDLFQQDEQHPKLNIHSLTGKLSTIKSFNVTGDIRVQYEKTGNGVILLNIGSHSQLYK